MRFNIIFLLLTMACQSGSTNEEQKVEAADSARTATHDEQELPVNYDNLYGQYLHESNTNGFTALLELKPQGNDLSFTLSLLHSTCDATLDGAIGMVYHGNEEYAGFFDSEPCRLAFNFFHLENKVRIDEIGVCRTHPVGCSFGGTYIKKKPAD